MRQAAVLLFLLCLGARALPQATVGGTITDPDGNPLARVSVRLLNAADTTLVAYCFSGDTGAYTLPVSRPGRYRLRFDALAYSPFESSLVLAAESGPGPVGVDAVLRPAPLELEEVTVRAEAAVQVGRDTVDFRVAAYTTGSERVVEEVLKRLPGIEVGTDGSIRVRGRAVSKVLIEGDDLFDRGYPLLTKNLSADVVEKVQVVKRFTGNPLLKGLQDAEAIALNIRLKEDVKGTLFGKGTLGAGPDSHKASMNLIRVTQGDKAVFLGNGNNTGEELSGDMNSLVGRQDPAGDPAPGSGQALASYMPQPPHETGLPQARTQTNRSEMASLSGVFNPSRDLKVKGHFYHLREKQRQAQATHEVFRFGGLRFENRESVDSHHASNQVSGSVSAVYLAGVQRLEWVTTLGAEKRDALKRLEFNGHPMSEATREGGWQAASRLTYSRRLDSTMALELDLHTLYESKPREVAMAGTGLGAWIAPGRPGTNLVHRLASQRGFAGFEASVLGRRGSLDGRLKVGYATRHTSLEGGFYEQGEGRPVAPQAYNRGFNRLAHLYAGVRLGLTFPKWELNGQLAASLLVNRLDDRHYERARALLLLPSLALKWLPGQGHSILATYSYDARGSSLQEHYMGVLPLGFRLLNRGLGSFRVFQSHHWLLAYTYGDWGDSFLLNSTLLFRHEPHFPGADSRVWPGLVYASATTLPNRDWLSCSQGLDHYLKGLKANLKLRAEWQFHRYENRTNGLARKMELLHFKAGPELRTVFDGGFNAHGGVSWMFARFRGEGISRSRSHSGFLDLEFRKGDWFLVMTNEAYRYRYAGSGKSLWFTDLALQYACRGGGTTLRFELANLWNSTRLRRLDLSDTGWLENRYALRPRQAVLALDFRF